MLVARLDRRAFYLSTLPQGTCQDHVVRQVPYVQTNDLVRLDVDISSWVRLDAYVHHRRARR